MTGDPVCPICGSMTPHLHNPELYERFADDMAWAERMNAPAERDEARRWARYCYRKWREAEDARKATAELVEIREEQLRDTLARAEAAEAEVARLKKDFEKFIELWKSTSTTIYIHDFSPEVEQPFGGVGEG